MCRGNSWATGDNPAVDSIYLRLLALNPALRGHNVNVAVSGSNVDNLATQAGEALDSQPVPDLFLIQTVDNDIQCDGTDAQNYGPFAATLTDVLGKLTAAAPKAKILIVSSPWATVDNYAKVAAQLEGPRGHNRGTGICDLFDPSGKPVPAHWRTLEGITLHYLGELKSVCAKFPACQYDCRHGPTMTVVRTCAGSANARHWPHLGRVRLRLDREAWQVGRVRLRLDREAWQAGLVRLQLDPVGRPSGRGRLPLAIARRLGRRRRGRGRRLERIAAPDRSLVDQPAPRAC
jgi:hypothetical protein